MSSFAKPVTTAVRFADTRWSLMLEARAGRERGAAEAMAWLCEAYWQPLYAYLRRAGHSAHDAEDLVQGFLARLIDRGDLLSADASRGSFRSFLISCLEHYLTDERRKELRQKRGGGARPLPLHDPAVAARVEASLVRTADPRAAYERAWALTVLDRALENLRVECDTEAVCRFDVLKSFLTGSRGELPFASAADQLGLSVAAVKSTVHRLRTRYRELIRTELRGTVRTESEVDDELKNLRNVLAG